ncbi:3'-5' exonuclease, partial [Streptomyces sp. NPDC052013]|uniref:3'-5' exonuclease n=1 Tax=Streptomyces sp. NPDC052013 TaxID=3365679 RepID=UPI0037CE1F67
HPSNTRPSTTSQPQSPTSQPQTEVSTEPGTVHIDQAAIAAHGITPQRVATAATFGQLLPRLATTLHGRAVVAYDAAFGRTVFERELRRHFADACAARDWLSHIRWHDAMAPNAVWHGLWSAKRGAYRNQPLGGLHDAVADGRLLLDKLRTMARSAPTARR